MKNRILSLIFLFICVSGLLAEEIDFIDTSTLNYTSSDLRDPFKSYLINESKIEEVVSEEAKEEEVILPTFKIKGIIWEAPIPMAIIDDKIVKIGDILKEARVIGIDKEAVTFLYRGKKFKVFISTYSKKEEEKK